MITAYIDEPFMIEKSDGSFAKVIGVLRGDTKQRAPDGFEVNAHVSRKFEIEEDSIIIQTPSGNRYKMENFDQSFLKQCIDWNQKYDAPKAN